MALKKYNIKIERINNGEPILMPTENWWENGVAFNPAVIFLSNNKENENIIKELLKIDDIDEKKIKKGIIAIFYRARPNDDNYILTRSYIGLAIFNSDYKLLKRYSAPILSPADDEARFDYLGIEDPRIIFINNKYYMLYAGVKKGGNNIPTAQLCWAESDNLLDWKKIGLVKGDVNKYENKDGVLFPNIIDGKYVMLHRPMIKDENGEVKKNMHLAVSDTITGDWEDYGVVMEAFYNPAVKESWVGAGSVPIPIDEKRYLVIYHVGNYLNDTDREYDLDAAIFDFNNFSKEYISNTVKHRMEHFMVPETEWEIKAPFKESVGNVLFTGGTFELDGYIHIIYGGADTYTLAARIKKDYLLEELKKCNNLNPFV